ncbi:hypothetical protein N7450_004554 [Penicillium hetheringtonii]|uniref:Uncharacterized protein n=1 Tax=Penicillium hetheringtonii TaxID=911720 RepID=A0AAD6GV80_9EURO|nr:hypothetical protein N7450_004554 [Penicillium hetheringtonii]
MNFRFPLRLVNSRLARDSRRVPASLVSASRRIATKSSGDTPFAYTWLTRTPQELSPDDVVTIPSFLSLPNSHTGSTPPMNSSPKLLGRLYGQSGPLYTVAAVIDKLPNETAFCATSLQADGPGVEGLSLLVVPELHIQGKAAPPRRIGGPASQEPDLGISIDAADLTTCQIGLRLAHTIFVNGKESTLLGMRWNWENTANDGGSYTLAESIDLSNCIVKSSSGVADIQSTMTLPLHPVGQRRKVISSMGNILREVSKSTDPNSLAPMPASSELEKELPRYIEDQDIVDQRVSVWALVEKPEATVSCSQDGLLDSVFNGGKLHRVMSGGGGWGKKQGLLSLDPEIGFPGTTGQVDLNHLDDLFNHSTSTTSELPPRFPDGIVGDDLSMLSQVAAEGDFIQFYASVESTPLQQNQPRQNKGLDDVSYCFGVVSEAEQMNSETSQAPQAGLTALPNAFGALSEKAITYSRSMPPSIDEGQETKVWMPGPNTKLDVPGCRVTLISVADSE